MKRLIYILLVSLTFSCTTKKSQKLSIKFNPNISTYSIVERLVANNQGRLFYIDGKANYNYIPMVAKAFNKFKNKDNSKIIQSTLHYLSIVGYQQDLTYQALVRSKKFPSKGFKYSLDSLNIDKEKITAVKQYVKDLREFYIKNNLASFFKENEKFINGGINEFKKNVPKNYVKKMQDYYGETFEKFIVYPDPFNTVGLNEGDTDFFHGNGQRIDTKNGTVATMITSAFLPINIKKQPNEYGFNYPKDVRFIITHEFGHSFVNHTLKTVKKQIKATEKLFNSGLSEKMQGQGYGSWNICLDEHLVRLGEIRIAECNGEKKRAEELRKMHINEFHFVLIPILEKKIVEYEKNRDKYPTYQNFLPELLSSLNKVSPKQVRELLGLSTKTYPTTINLKVPNKKDEVFIVGNQSVLGNWNPSKIKMNKSSNFERSIKLNLYKNTKFKFTKGSWDSEGNLEKFKNGQNIELKIDKDTIYNFKISSWKK
ncbi:MAG: DUF4932 domain-containing protein [Lutibacter sp.]|uniref:DUF4932 domain-containing protein n=1 Tax=Lutibacter sp. TaxID=1925666 RepID=UPI00299EE75C|nr:DUF4932 domain-containing protein [Lutibacter sp.]MDX1828635.1 DUF4932 domain-containing protein [Lutibacter sp.]